MSNGEDGIDTTAKEKKPSMLKVWVLASRPHTLTAALSPVLVGYDICKTYCIHLITDNEEIGSNNSNQSLFQLTFQWLLFCIFIQLATNLHNDYADFVKGADTDKRIGQARATQKGWLTPEQTCRGCDACLLAAFIIGMRLAKSAAPSDANFDGYMLIIVVTSMFNAVAYTGGPYPLGYIGLPNVSIGYSGLGDLFVFLYFGLVATMTVPYLLYRNSAVYRDLNLLDMMRELKPAFLVSLPVGWLATAIIVVNNLRDRETDIHAGKRTIAVRFGATFCRLEYAFQVIGSLLWVSFVVLQPSLDAKHSPAWEYFRFLPWLSLILGIPLLRDVSFGKKDFAQLNPLVGRTAQLQLLFSLLLSVSLRNMEK